MTSFARRNVVRVVPNGRQRPVMGLSMRGHDPQHPIILGACDDDDVPALVTATGMAGNVRSGQTRWVAGSGVAAFIANGLLVVVVAQAPDPPPPRLTRIAEGTPGGDPDHLAGLDLWPLAYTPCAMCVARDDGLIRAADPGSELCAECTLSAAIDAVETPLEKALRAAGH